MSAFNNFYSRLVRAKLLEPKQFLHAMRSIIRENVPGYQVDDIIQFPYDKSGTLQTFKIVRTETGVLALTSYSGAPDVYPVRDIVKQFVIPIKAKTKVKPAEAVEQRVIEPDEPALESQLTDAENILKSEGALDDGIRKNLLSQMKEGIIQSMIWKFAKRMKRAGNVAADQQRVVIAAAEAGGAEVGQMVAQDAQKVEEVIRVANNEELLIAALNDPKLQSPVDAPAIVDEASNNLVRIKVKSTLAEPDPTIFARVQAWYKRKRQGQAVPGVPIAPAPVTAEQAVEVSQEVIKQFDDAVQQGAIQPSVANAAKQPVNSKGWSTRSKIAAGVTGLALVGGASAALTWYLGVKAPLVLATVEHQKVTNGCYLWNTDDGSYTKVKLLSCGHFATDAKMETCETVSFTPGQTTMVSKCPDTTFNPCTKTSKNRSTSNTNVPLVPNVCDQYLYRNGKPAQVTGVQTIDACLTAEGKDLPKDQACSNYCKTENFNLPPYMKLVCVQMNFDTAFVDLLGLLGYEPETLLPPPPPPASLAATTWSKPLLLASGVMVGLFALLTLIYYIRKRRTVN